MFWNWVLTINLNHRQKIDSVDFRSEFFSADVQQTNISNIKTDGSHISASIRNPTVGCLKNSGGFVTWPHRDDLVTTFYRRLVTPNGGEK